ncbi:hypothetical protein [Nonlabens ponticola]|uniref:STAS/SEC14 domain-containing protein n=1 Tax=Nonlabens ponticola TaxID=2496866 RepID=A0A3S9MVY6_9FLAO|nr:hypothetical protein [Nonlabens ponticola]AZQ43385.1 hypothetical protein EJ995_03715 [Nonlabens ponticola]
MIVPSIKDSIYYENVIREITLECGDFYFFESHLVSEIHEGVLFGGEEALDIFSEAISFYNGTDRPKHFVYISNRVNDYSLRPVDWLQFKFMNRFMKGFATVDNRPRAAQNAMLLEKFVPSKFKLFANMSDAMIWAIDIYKSYHD